MRLKSTVAVLALAGMSLASCHSSSTPTTPGTINVVITTTIANTSLKATLIEAQLLFDGTEITDNTATAASVALNLNASGPTSTGAHTLTFVVVQQTSTPNSYTVTSPDIKEYDSNNNLLKDVVLPTQSATLATGQVIQYSFTL